MIDILIGVIAGMAVCSFGMWCFIHGQKNAISLLRREVPEQIIAPEILDVVENIKAKKDETPSMQQQVNAIRSYDGGIFPDEG